MEQKKIIITSISGIPNVGKSTLLNALIDFDLAPISSKAQTTRKSIRGIVNIANLQIVLIDTPGVFFSNKKTVLERVITKDAWANLKCSEVSILVFDPLVGLTEDYIKIMEALDNLDIKYICFVNKYDIKSNKIRTTALVDQLSRLPSVEHIIFGSAKTKEGIHDLIRILQLKAKEGDWIFDSDAPTDVSVKDIVPEKLREFLFENMHKEIPYSLNVTTQTFCEEDGFTKIWLLVEVERDSHKKIIIGKNGSNLKRAIAETSKKVESFIDNPLIFIHIKVAPKWKSKF